MSDEKLPSSALRKRFEQDYALPLARALFELEPRCQSVLITIGQYWCDEATDAVHSEAIACAERDPAWPLAGQARPGALGDPEVLTQVLEDQAKYASDAGPFDLREVQDELHRTACQQAFGRDYFEILSDNSDMIVAFASYCREASDQEQPTWRSHTPYGLIRRALADEPLEFEVVGSMYRPVWEDRWDVLEEDGIISASDADHADSVSSRSASPELAGARLTAHAPGTRAQTLRPVHWLLLLASVVLTLLAARWCAGK